MRRPVLALALALLSCAPAARAEQAEAGRRVTRGTWLSVKGDFTRDDLLLADDIAPAEEEKMSAKGALGPVDLEARTVRFGPLVLRVREATRLEEDDGSPLALESLKEGDRVKLSLSQQEDGEVRLQRLRRLPAGTGSTRIEGPVEWLSPPSARVLALRLLGVTVECAGADWEGLDPPRTLRDDDDRRPDEGLSLGKGFRLSGEVRLDLRHEDELDLASNLPDEVTTRRHRSELELAFPSSKRLSGMAELKLEYEHAIEDESGREDGRTTVKPGEAWLLVSGLGKHLSLQVGRCVFDDERDWIFRKDLDAVRLFADFSRVHLEASVSAQLFDPERRQRDMRNVLLLGSFSLPHRQQVTAWILDRHDAHVEPPDPDDPDPRFPNGKPRDFSPRYYGLHASGEPGKRWTWWLDAARATGNIGRDRTLAHAIDAGSTVRLARKLEPTLAFGYAWGEGDPEPGSGDERSFRQTGLHGNNGKWNGVTNFRYYGELLRPELSNLHVTTLGFGIKPRSRTSIDLAWHSYRLDEVKSEIRTAIKGRGMDRVNDDVGSEWDLVVGVEEWEHLELELDVGWFRPGSAWRSAPVDDALIGGFKAKYVF